MAFFRNTTVNLLNLHYSVHALAISGGGAFFAVFLLKAGVPVPGVLLAMAAILIGRFAIRPAVLPLGRRYGLKPLVIAGTIVTALQYPLLAEVHGVGWQLYVLCIVSSIGDTLYWTAYHAYFASLGDAEHRGHQISAREAAAAMVGIVAPLLTGWALVTVGPRLAFGVTATALLLSALPLLWAPNVRIPAEAPGSLRAALPGVLLFMADGWTAMGYAFVWQIALFITLDESFTAFGGAMAFAAIVGAICGLFLGRFIDAGHGRRAVWLAASVMTATIAARAIGVLHPAAAILANAAGAVVVALYTPTMMTAVYNLSKRSPCVLRFHIAAEGGWDAGGASACLAAAALIWAGAPMSAAICLAFLGTAGAFVLLRRAYGAPQPTVR
ncbi:MFS transporter [Phenylobacterium sp.]|uniref:MFS transporter n=1 Tax=Phenylobacterium sp. TaxID=1871053 RepID=UPI00273192A4|nr:MFS transporter [Phenylobacterium sp.]MDP1598196.1 MFS transporter [Phenylobacterium sp.]MDP3592683.1 MFS transporter [Phenylobacterium sp.]